MRTLLKIIGLLVFVVVIVVVVGIFNLDRAIKAVVEGLGPDYVQAPITLDEVDLSLKNGEGRLGGLVIGNPAGFQTDYAFSLGEIDVKVDTKTVTEKVIVIDRIHILSPSIIYEAAKGGSNLDRLQKNIQAATGGGSSGQAAEAAPDSGEEPVKVIIRDLQVSDGQIHYSNALLGGRTVDVRLPKIQLTNLGQNSGGVTAAEVLEQLLKVINKSASNAIANSDSVRELRDELKEQIEEKTKEAIGDKIQGFFNRD